MSNEGDRDVREEEGEIDNHRIVDSDSADASVERRDRNQTGEKRRGRNTGFS
jgi:hypothetical protein